MRLIVFIASLLFLATAAAATQTHYIDAPEDGALNLRSGPSMQYRLITEMPHGSRVTLYASAGQWRKLRHETGAIGWAHGGWLSADRPEPAEPKLQTLYVHAPAHGALNLRDGPGTDHPVILTMAQGSTVDVLGAQGDWLFVRHGSDRFGWAHAGYLVEARPGPSRRATPKPGPHPFRTCRGRDDADLQLCLAQAIARLVEGR